MNKTLRVIIIALGSLIAWPTLAADMRYARPLPQTASGRVNYYFDDDRTNGQIKRYDCSASGAYDQHDGTDFSATVGTAVYAARTGGLYKSQNDCPTIGYLGDPCGSKFGNNVRIDHDGNLYDGIGIVTIYAHLKQWSAAYPMSVRCGGQVGLSGSSGNSSGPHLHFEVRRNNSNGTWVSLDLYAGACSRPTALWTNIGANNMPGTACEW